MNKRDFLTMLLASAFFPTRTSAKSAVNNRDAQAFVLSLSYSEHPNLALGNTANDGRLMSTIFRKLGFGSVEHLSDTDGEKFAAAFDRFADRIAPSTKAFVYLAGHGIQIAGSNYLLLGDGKTYVELRSIIETIRQKAQILVLMVDACRNNPYLDAGNSAGEGRSVRALSFSSDDDSGGNDHDRARKAGFSFRQLGLAEEKASRIGAFSIRGTGVKVIFSTDPANVAADWIYPEDENSPFAKSVAARIMEKRSLDDVMSMVTGDVVKVSAGKQSPWSQGSVGVPIFLAGPPENRNPAKTPFLVPG